MLPPRAPMRRPLSFKSVSFALSFITTFAHSTRTLRTRALPALVVPSCGSLSPDWNFLGVMPR